MVFEADNDKIKLQNIG